MHAIGPRPRTGAAILEPFGSSAMVGPRLAQPSQGVLEALHENALKGDDSARHDLCRAIVALLSQSFRPKYRSKDPALVAESISAAALRLWLSPGRYRPERGDLIVFAKKLARDHLVDLIRRDARRAIREKAAGAERARQDRVSGASPQAQDLLPVPSHLMQVCRTTQEQGFVKALRAGNLGDAERALGIDTCTPAVRARVRRCVVKRLRQRHRRLISKANSAPQICRSPDQHIALCHSAPQTRIR